MDAGIPCSADRTSWPTRTRIRWARTGPDANEGFTMNNFDTSNSKASQLVIALKPGLQMPNLHSGRSSKSFPSCSFSRKSLNLSELNLPFIRFLLKWSFNIRGKAKLNALLQELQGYNDTIERTLALCYHSSSRRQGGLAAPPMGHHVCDAIAASKKQEDGYLTVNIIPPLTLVSQPLSATPSHHPTVETHIPNYSSHPSHQASVGRRRYCPPVRVHLHPLMQRILGVGLDLPRHSFLGRGTTTALDCYGGSIHPDISRAIIAKYQ